MIVLRCFAIASERELSISLVIPDTYAELDFYSK